MTDVSDARLRRQRGFALLIVLWTLALLALLGTQLVASGRSDAQLARNLVDAANLEAATNGAVQQAIFGMLEPVPQRWQTDGSLHVVRLGAAVVTLRLEADAGEVNPNIASADLLRSLLLQVGAPPATAASVAAAIVDWRSSTPQPSTLGAKAPQYAAAGRDYGPPGSPFRSVDELGLVLGMTPELLARLAPHLTVYSESDPDASTSDPVVEAALGNPPPLPAADEAGVFVATVVAEARGLNHSAFAERVVVRLMPQPGRRPYDILSIKQIAPDSGGVPRS
jgi:general secretion pathway protein K